MVIGTAVIQQMTLDFQNEAFVVFIQQPSVLSPNFLTETRVNTAVLIVSGVCTLLKLCCSLFAQSLLDVPALSFASERAFSLIFCWPICTGTG